MPRRPTIAVAMIVRNEERDLPRALASVAPIADFLCVVDTGSTDRTMEVARTALSVPTTVRQYLGASEQDESGAWLLWSFADARNESLKDAEATGADFVLWMDADDELLTPNALRRAIYQDEYDVFSCIMHDGPLKWPHHRLLRASARVRFKGRIHEYVVIDHLRVCSINESAIRHHSEPHASQENSNPRNLRILMREWAEEETPRTAYYIADTYRFAPDGAEQAIDWYAKRIAMEGYSHEKAFAMLYRTRLLRGLKRFREAGSQLWAASEEFPDWHEFTMEAAAICYDEGRYAEAIDVCKTAIGKPIPPTPLWREPECYGDRPLRLTSWCYENLGEIDLALVYSKRAAKAIGKPDEEWAMRERRLAAMLAANDAPAPAIIKRLRRQVALHRPGAIGDILMTLNLIPAFKVANPETDVHYFCDARLGAPDALGGVIMAAGVDLVMDCATLPQWSRGYDKVINLVGYPLAEGHPQDSPRKFVMRKHLLEYFAEEMGLATTWYAAEQDRASGSMINGRIDMPALTLPRPPLPGFGVSSGEYATIQAHAGWSTYKRWPLDRWLDVGAALAERHIPIMLVGENQGRTLAESIALVANARVHLGIDSFANHLTNYFWTDERSGRRVPGVIVWGSTQPSALGYAHNTNIYANPDCGPCWRETAAWSKMEKVPCPNAHKCMQDISVRTVVDAAIEAWEGASK